MSTPRRTVPPERQAVYYLGTILAVIGFLTFGSVFVTAAARFGDFSNFEDNARSEMFRAIAGMAMMILGGVLSGIGKSGLAGSGVILDPEQAREDLEPFNRASGGMVSDALDEVGVVKEIAGNLKHTEVVKVRCQNCQALNDEQAKFCNQCGQAI